MITTPRPVLKAISERLNESDTDVSDKRLGIFDQALHHHLNQYKWKWARKSGNLTVEAGTTEYSLLTAFTDYNITWGIDSVSIGDQIYPVEYEDRAFFISQHFTLTPDKKTIIFTKDVDTGTVPIWYYAEHTDVSAPDETLAISIPEAHLAAVVLYAKHLVHDGKRQRNDARNAILDYQEVVEQLALQNGSTNAKYLTKTRRNPLQFAGIRRTYAEH